MFSFLSNILNTEFAILIPLRRTVQEREVRSRCTAVTTARSSTFSSSQTQTLYLPHNDKSPSPFLASPPQPPLSSHLSGFDCFSSWCERTHSVCPFAGGSLGIVSLGSPVLSDVPRFPSFLRLNNTPLYVWTTSCLSVYEHVGCFHLLALSLMTVIATNLCGQISESLLSVLWGTNLAVEFYDVLLVF